MYLKKRRTLSKNNNMMSVVRCIPNQEKLKCEKNMHYRINEICSSSWSPDLQENLAYNKLHCTNGWKLVEDSGEEAWLAFVLGLVSLCMGKRD